jgi:hypothetical protein
MPDTHRSNPHVRRGWPVDVHAVGAGCQVMCIKTHQEPAGTQALPFCCVSILTIDFYGGNCNFATVCEGAALRNFDPESTSNSVRRPVAILAWRTLSNTVIVTCPLVPRTRGGVFVTACATNTACSPS